MADWESQIAGDRMAVDGEFAERVDASSLSSQQWSLVMTAVSFEIENPETPDEARLVADTSHLGAMMSEVQKVGKMGPAGGGREPDDSSRGVLGNVLSSIGLGGDGGAGSDALQGEAEELADEYADRLQKRLVEQGRWESTCERAAAG